MTTIADHLHPLTGDFLARLPASHRPGKQLHRAPDGRVVGDWFGLALAWACHPLVGLEQSIIKLELTEPGLELS